MKSKFNSNAFTPSDYGNGLRDDVLQFQLDNEVGNTLTVAVSGTTVTLTLKSKSGNTLSTGSFTAGSGGGASISNIYLDNTNKRLDFTMSDSTHIYCVLYQLYDEIDKKQDQLTVNPTTTTSTLTGLTIDGTSYKIEQPPETYIKSASVLGQVLTLVNQDGGSFTFIPTANNFTNELKSKLDGITSGATKVESSETNGNIKINGTETTVYTEASGTVHDANYKHITVSSGSGVTDGTNTYKYTLPSDVVQDSSYQHITVSSTDGVTSGTTTYKYDDTSLTSRVYSLETTVGNSSSGLVKEVNDVNAGLTSESQTRASADTTLTNNLASEVTARTNADTSLSSSIEAEATTRASAISTLTSSLSSETSARTSGDATLTSRIETEENTRASAVSTLTSNLSSETSARESADSTLTSNLATEVSDRQSAVTAEATTRATEDTSLSNRITSEETARTTAVSNEATLRANADTTLSNRISALEGRGRYLSGWNATTGVPLDYPTIPEGSSSPYTYNFQSGDYYTVSNVPESGTQYAPTGSSITATYDTETQTWTWATSRVVTTDELSANDTYIYSSTGWNLIHGSSGVLDTSVKLSSQLKTYYNIGKITTASGTNPVVIGNAGDSIRDVLNNLTQMDELQPTKVDPAINSVTFSSSDSDEYGTSITNVNYSISKTDGSYTYDSTTGVSWSNYNFSGGCESTDKSTTSGSLTLSSPYTVGTSSAVSFTCVGTHGAGNVAKTNLGNDSNPVIQITAGTKTQTGSFSKTSALYPYYMLSDSETLSTIAQGSATKSTQSACTSGGVSVTTSANTYMWFILPSSYSQSKIQYKALGEWYDWDGGTSSANTVTITLNSGGQKTDYKAYRIGTKMAVGTTTFRIIS